MVQIVQRRSYTGGNRMEGTYSVEERCSREVHGSGAHYPSSDVGCSNSPRDVVKRRLGLSESKLHDDLYFLNRLRSVNYIFASCIEFSCLILVLNVGLEARGADNK